MEVKMVIRFVNIDFETMVSKLLESKMAKITNSVNSISSFQISIKVSLKIQH